MFEPNFCEAQLQQLVNTEIFNRFRGFPFGSIFPVVISPIEEDRLGWDTGYFFPWLGPGLQRQRGCNFFIQYKLSNRYDHPSVSEWSFWQSPFYKFNLGYKRNRRWDFTQRNHLVRLFESGFATVYVTNHIVEFIELTTLAEQNKLCSELPALPSTNRLRQHKKVTFLSDGDNFRLHSSIEVVEQTSISKTLEQVKPTLLKDDLNTVVKVLTEYEEAAGIKERRILQAIEKLPEVGFFYSKTRLAASYLKKYLNVDWIWIGQEN